MRFISNNFSSSDLIIILHGQYGGIDKPLEKNIFSSIKNLKKRVVLIEFSYVKSGETFDPDQEVEVNEVKSILQKTPYKNLTIIAHSNAIFITLMLWEMKVKIDGLILLGFPMMQSEDTPKEMASMLRKINNYGSVFIIQARKDEYGSIDYVRNFLEKYKLRIKLLALDGNHHFEGFENKVGQTIRNLLQ